MNEMLPALASASAQLSREPVALLLLTGTDVVPDENAVVVGRRQIVLWARPKAAQPTARSRSRQLLQMATNNSYQPAAGCAPLPVDPTEKQRARHEILTEPAWQVVDCAAALSPNEPRRGCWPSLNTTPVGHGR
jgi:hypothetical protein